MNKPSKVRPGIGSALTLGRWGRGMGITESPYQHIRYIHNDITDTLHGHILRVEMVRVGWYFSPRVGSQSSYYRLRQLSIFESLLREGVNNIY